MDPPACCLLALHALYKMYQAKAVYYLNAGGYVAKDERFLHWKVFSVAPAEDIEKLRYHFLKAEYKSHRNGKHWLNSFPKP